MLNVNAVNSFLQEFLAAHQSGYTVAGCSRAIKTIYHPWIRIIATCYTLILTWYDCPNADKLSVQVTYAIVDQHGELHPPKDFMRNEIALSPATQTAIREQALADIVSFYQMGEPLSAGFLHQLGETAAAMETEAMESNSTGTSTASASS